MRFNFFPNLRPGNTPSTVNSSKEIIRSNYGLQWIPNSFKPNFYLSDSFDFTFVNIKAPYSQEEQTYFSNLFLRRNNYITSYNSKVAASRFHFSSFYLYERPKSNYANNFFCSYSVKIPNSRIFFFRSNGFTRGSFLISSLNRNRLEFFKKTRALIFYSLFNKSTRFLFFNFSIKAHLFKSFFRINPKKGFKTSFVAKFATQNIRYNSNSTNQKKRKKLFEKNSFFLFLKSNFLRNLISEFQAFYKSDDLYIFNNVRIANIKKKYTKLSI